MAAGDSWAKHISMRMRQAQEGDRVAYAELLAEIAPWIRRYIRYTQPYLTTETVEDVSQEVLISLHAVRSTYDPARPFIPWLKTIARNRIVDEARRYYRQSRNEIKVDTLPETSVVDSTNPSHETYEDRVVLREAIKSLPPKQRVAIEMLKIRQLSLIEAERESGIPVGSLKVAVHRGIKSLRKLMQDGDGQ